VAATGPSPALVGCRAGGGGGGGGGLCRSERGQRGERGPKERSAIPSIRAPSGPWSFLRAGVNCDSAPVIGVYSDFQVIFFASEVI